MIDDAEEDPGKDSGTGAGEDAEKGDGVADRRSAPRKRVLQKGQLFHLESNATMDCVVLDLSESGARLRPADAPRCPEQFRLRGPDGGLHHCEVVWRDEQDIGVRFI